MSSSATSRLMSTHVAGPAGAPSPDSAWRTRVGGEIRSGGGRRCGSRPRFLVGDFVAGAFFVGGFFAGAAFFAAAFVAGAAFLAAAAFALGFLGLDPARPLLPRAGR